MLKSVIDESSQTELEISDKHDPMSLINSLVQTSVEISSLASQSSRSPSLITCTTFEEDDERQAALQDLISHLEDTAALLRDYLLPPKSESFSSSNISSFEQTTFLLKYQIVLVLFTQISELPFRIFADNKVILNTFTFDHLLEKVEDTGYNILTIACGVVLQILNMLLVAFATGNL
ncbi:uncharacterized protein TNCT_141891 [Trichonephila clavata]|uniref:Uncharacterized protein n=1 Tax=Trichonephila clavata TaxID=2740835 RepID=A0A8X6J2Q1_TRICU|nr:uncharacterized protein TNCT_141891 [Trichonephila clavata]